MSSASAGPVTLQPVQDAAGRRAFVDVPWRVFAGDPNWVPPLRFERLEALAPKQPVFKHLEWAAWVAYRDGVAVGRISAQVDSLHLEHYNDATGFFGFLDAIDDAEVFDALFDAAEGWLRGRGMRRVRGPFSFNINQEVGLLVEGFDSKPYFMMTHARPYYASALERRGYAKAVDMFAYLISARFEPPPVMAALFARLARKVSIRPLDRKHTDRDLDTVCEIFNDAW